MQVASKSFPKLKFLSCKSRTREKRCWHTRMPLLPLQLGTCRTLANQQIHPITREYRYTMCVQCSDMPQMQSPLANWGLQMLSHLKCTKCRGLYWLYTSFQVLFINAWKIALNFQCALIFFRPVSAFDHILRGIVSHRPILFHQYVWDKVHKKRHGSIVASVTWCCCRYCMDK